MTDTSKAAIEEMIERLEHCADYRSRVSLISASQAAADLLRQLKDEREWKPIKSVPLNTIVDVWCVGQQGVPTYDGVSPVGGIERNRFKSDKYGWFGNQSDAGLPQKDGPDLQPVAWRHPVAPCPFDLIAKATGWPLPTPPQEGE